MKKMIALLLALIMVFSLVACSGSADTAKDTTTTDSTTTDTADTTGSDTTAEPASTEGSVINVCLASEPDTIDPALNSVAAADENSLTPLHRFLPAETASLGFGGSPVGGGDKTPVLHFFGISVWGGYHYPRRMLHAVETLGAQGTRWLNKLLVVYSLPVGSASAHSGSQGQTRGVFTA